MGNSNSGSDDVLNSAGNYTVENEPLFDDPTCVDGAVPTPDEDDDDEVIDLDWLLTSPAFTVVAETIRCRGKNNWVNLTIEYIGEDSSDFEYEFEITEIDPEDVPLGVTIHGNNN